MSGIDVALDVRQTSHMSVGMRQYASELASRLPRIAPDLRFATFGSGDNFNWAEQVAMPLEIARMRPRLVHFLSPYAPIVVPADYLVTIHDLIDLHFPLWAKPKARWYYRVPLRRTARRARFVVTDDSATAEDLRTFYGVPRERIAVIPLGVDLPDVTPIRREVRYAMYAGNRRPHKDLQTLVRAWASVDPSLELDLVLTAAEDPALRIAGRERGRLVFLGDLPHADVLGWIAGASVLAHAALREGFGLPLLEAVRLGTPVVAAESSVPEPLREWVRTFPSGDAGALARAMGAVLRGEDGDRSAAARAATSTLTWDRCAAATAALYRTCLA